MQKYTPTIIITSIALLAGLVPCVFFSDIVTATSDNKYHHNATIIAENDTESEKSNKGLNGRKLRICQQKQPDIASTMQRISTQGANQLAVFHDIAERTKAFYATKGYSNAEYAATVNEAEALYGNASASISSLTSLSQNWSCSDSNPKQNILVFRDAKKAEVAALQAYKDKVRALILLVKNTAKEKQ